MKIRKSKFKKGVSLVVVVVFAAIFSFLGFAMLSLAETEIVMTRQDMSSIKAFYAAEAGIELGVVKLKALLNEQRQVVDKDSAIDIAAKYEITSPELKDCTFDIFTIEKVGGLERKKIDSGPCKGMEAFTQNYKITSEATDSCGASSRLVQYVEDQRIQLFQFAAFYEQDLELEPGAEMTIKGRIHSNSDIYLTSGNTLYIDSFLTTAGDIYRKSKPGDPGEEGGAVEIKDTDGSYQVMDFDSTDPDWANKAIETWGGKVQSQTHSTSVLSLPIPAECDPIDIIKRGQSDDPETLKQASLYWQADLRIIDGVAYDKSGAVIDLTGSVDTSKSFHNYREAKDIKVTEIDISKLVESGQVPANGILYVSSRTAGAGQQDGVRLVNGSDLPEGGLTVATDNPLYIQGDYNKNQEPAAVLCDAINILSAAWTDIDTWVTAKGTEVNTSILAGHSPTTEGGYGGGLENLFRFLEPWSGETFKWSGSINSLWYSQIATGKWVYGQPYYQAPKRDWQFDEKLLDLANLPPGTPVVCIPHRSDWKEDLP